MNFANWMDGAFGIPTWMWLTAIVVGCAWVILWSLAIESGRRDKAEMARVVWLQEKDREE